MRASRISRRSWRSILSASCNDRSPTDKNSHVSVGEPANVILKFVQENDIDLVVITSRGSESHFDFGSVADRVIKCTTVPIITVPV